MKVFLKLPFLRAMRRTVYEFYDFECGNLNPSVKISPRIAPQLMGLGLLENVAETDILIFQMKMTAIKIVYLARQIGFGMLFSRKRS
jgi:hypothetical protein